MLVVGSIAILFVLSVQLTNDHETEKDRGRSTARESTTRTNEQTSANGTTPIERQSVHVRLSRILDVPDSHGNHLHVPALQTLVQGVCALSQALAVGGVGRAIVELLLTERGAGLCFHGGVMCCFAASRVVEVGEFSNARGQSKTARGVEGRPRLMKRDLARQSKLAMHSDKLVAGWSQGMLP